MTLKILSACPLLNTSLAYLCHEKMKSRTPPITNIFAPPFTLTDLAKIIERDSKDSTYKFALLRGTIDIIQNFPHYRETDGKTISYPMGLMVLKWIEYYYPLLARPYFMSTST